MGEIALVKISELNEILDELKLIKQEIKELREREDSLKAYSIQQVADMLNLHYTTVRKLVLKKKIFAKYIDEEKECGKSSIPAWAIKEYLQQQGKIINMKRFQTNIIDL